MIEVFEFSDDFYKIFKKQSDICYVLTHDKIFLEKLNLNKIVYSEMDIKAVGNFSYPNDRRLFFLISEIEYQDIILNKLQSKSLDIFIVDIKNNIAFADNFWSTRNTYCAKKIKKTMRINIVCQDSGWIFKKFADKMKEELIKIGVCVSVTAEPRDDVDINHHIPYAAYRPYKNDTLMITHVDNSKKVDLLRKQLETAGVGICMSKQTVDLLTSYGVPRSKLCYINPAQDNNIRPKKYIIGITHKNHVEDFRKNDSALLTILDGIDSCYFKFCIMGAGWESIVHELKLKKFEVDYFPDFDYEKYIRLMENIDYYFYSGFDEGSMGFLDAMAAGAGMIITPQGYHLDTNCMIEYPCSTIKEFHNAFFDLQQKKQRKVKEIEEWTWENYAKKHLEIWNYLLRRKNLSELFKNQLLYKDGFFSMQIEDNR